MTATIDNSTIVMVDPRELLVDTNIRADLQLDKGFIASIRDLGVLEPITAYRTEEGIKVFRGHRRTAGAIEAGRLEVPVHIGDSPEDAQRIVEQLAENYHRKDITTDEKVEAIHQLSLIGVSANQIVKRTPFNRADVDAALAIADNTQAREVAGQHSLQVAAWCLEFNDDEQAVSRILNEARWGEGRARHLVERIRSDKKEQALRVLATAELIEGGWNVIDRPDYKEKTITRLWDLKGAKNKEMTEEAHVGCPGHAISISLADTPAEDEDEFEDEDDAQDSDQATESTIEAAGAQWEYECYCIDPTANGHKSRWSTGSVKPVVEPEAAKAERKRVIAANKAWAAAEVVRAEFIEQLLSRKSAPKDALLFVVGAIHNRASLSGYGKNLDQITTAAVATMALVAMTVSDLEKSSTKDDWRRHSEGTAFLLTSLAEWGYTLSAVEESAAGSTPFAIETE